MRKLLRREDGVALVMALGMCVVLTIMVTAIVTYTSASSRNSSVSRGRVTALTLAEAGIDEATSILNSTANASSPTALGCSTSSSNINDSAAPCTPLTVTAPGGTASFYGMYTQGSNSGTWTITSVGSVANPTGAAALEKQLTATVTIVGGGQANNISVWNYVYSTAPQGSGCELDITGTNTIVDVPLYVTGDLCLSGTNVQIMENLANGGQPIDVRVGGTLKYKGSNATVGTSSAPITSGLVSGGCITTANPTAHTCTTADNWYVKQTDSPLTATPPTVDFTSWYQNASPGPNHVCDTTLTASPNLTATTNVFDNDTTMNGTNTTFDLTPSGSDYNCVTSSGTLSWNHTTSLLTVSGTIFFDGNVKVTTTAGMYHGLATIYVNGTVDFSGTNASLHAGCPASPATPTHQCAFSNVSKEWDPNKDMIIFVANKSPGTAVELDGSNTQYQGGISCSSSSTADLSGTNVQMEGPIICGKYSWGTNTKILPLPTVTNVPPGAPVPPNAPATIGQPVFTGG